MTKLFRTTLRERRDRISWRGKEVTRIEAFSDSVFAFALTLLIVSLQVPQNINELFAGMKSFLPFAVCFAILFQVWIAQNTFFRRFGLHDNWTLTLNAMLLFFVLFFVYPLKFMFSSLFSLGFHITPPQLSKLYYIYSGGFAIIYLLFTLLYFHALRQRESLQLKDSECFETLTGLYRNLFMAGVGLFSVLMASFQFFTPAWVIYVMIGPLLGILLSARGRRFDKRFEEEMVVVSRKVCMGSPVRGD